MYIPAHFLQQDREAALDLMAREPFALLVSTAGGAPMISHIPIVVTEREPELILAAHVAKANPHWRTLDGARATAVFRGIHGYISPRWYSDPAHDVPTWNYEVVHCTGTVTIAPDSAKEAILRQLVDVMEAGLVEPWSVNELEANFRESLQAGIVAFTLRVEQLEAKFKLGQNRARADREGARAGLRRTGRSADAALASEMERFSPPD
jgi:transcriptional regulator